MRSGGTYVVGIQLFWEKSNWQNSCIIGVNILSLTRTSNSTFRKKDCIPIIDEAVIINICIQYSGTGVVT